MPPTPHDGYQSPLETRNASAAMRRTWSAQRKHSTWRQIWAALAESQHAIGLPVTAAQVAELRAHLDDIDFTAAAAHEKRLRHDVMAHVHAYGDAAPGARAIIHLGATSQDVVCNADTIVLRDALAQEVRATDRLIRDLRKHELEHEARMRAERSESRQPMTILGPFCTCRLRG